MRIEGLEITGNPMGKRLTSNMCRAYHDKTIKVGSA